MDEKIYTIYAGVNGAGKSSLYSEIGEGKAGIRINPDEIVQKIGSWKNNDDQMKAARIAVETVKNCIKDGKSFNQETTLAGRTIINNIKKAKEAGFTVDLFYVGLESSDLANARVKERVQKGGHDIPEDLIKKRYVESLENLKQVIPLCDLVQIYDNTTYFHSIFKMEENICIKYCNCKWFDKTISSEMLQKLEMERSNQRIKQINYSQEIKQAGFQPTKKLQGSMEKVDQVFGSHKTVKEIRNLYKNKENLSPEEKKVVEGAAKDFIQQEKANILFLDR